MIYIYIAITTFLRCKFVCSSQVGKLALAAQVYQCIEYFCGTAMVSKCMLLAEHPTASLDVNLGHPLPGKQNAMDLTTPSGVAFFR